MNIIDDFFGHLNALVGSVMFFDLLWFADFGSLPFAVAWLISGGLFFTFKLRFINIRFIKHAVQIVSGKYDKQDTYTKDTVGEVSHFQALSAALSATVGLGNIAGVAVAISLGGPGATFWMIVAGFIGMTTKFVECTLAQMYRVQRPNGTVLGGPMVYLRDGLKELGHPQLGKVLSIVFAILTIGGSFGGGGSFQVNQSLAAVQKNIPIFAQIPWLYGLVMAGLVGVVIIGGLKRIAKTASNVVPLMGVIYLGACFYIIALHADQLPLAFYKIIVEAFQPNAVYGGLLGVLIIGFQRAAFSNEAGVGSAAIAHAAAQANHPVREGFVALLEPLIDTIFVCTVTALVIILTGVYEDPALQALRDSREGAALTSMAFSTGGTWFPIILSCSVFLFAYSTIISWSYYGERCWVFLFSEKTSIVYKLLLLFVVFSGAITSATNVINFGDLMILSMAIPNLLGMYLLSGKVAQTLSEYLKQHRSTQ